jgi:hypothetical protein
MWAPRCDAQKGSRSGRRLTGQSHTRLVHVWSLGVLRRQAHVLLNRVDVRCRKVANVHPAGCRMIDGHLHGWAAYDEVAENQIALCTRGQDHDAVRIPP